MNPGRHLGLKLSQTAVIFTLSDSSLLKYLIENLLLTEQESKISKIFSDKRIQMPPNALVTGYRVELDSVPR